MLRSVPRTIVVAALLVAFVAGGIALSTHRTTATFPGQINGKIAWSYYMSGANHIAVANPDGGDNHDLTTGPVFDQLPSWSKDGTKIVFNRNVDVVRIWTMDADGGNQAQVPGADVTGYLPKFSPDGATIYFLKDNDIVKVATSGGAVSQVTNSGDVFAFAVSPDGETLLFSDGSNNLKTISSGGGSADLLGLKISGSPSFSPDGQRITYEDYATSVIAVAHVDGSNATPLGEGGYSPVFSPDGNYIAWSNTDFGTGTSVQGDAPYHIWVMDADGDNAHALVASPHTQESNADWQPLGGTWTPTPSPTPTPTHSPTPTPTPSPTPMITPSPTPTRSGTPTPTGSPEEILGDADCDGDVDMDDALADLSDFAGLDPGTCDERGDTDCDGAIDPMDALRIAAFVAGVPMTPASGCGQVGT